MTTPRSLLVLGGTSWLGGAIARVALERGTEVTCLARGESGSVPEGARHVVADRWRADAYDEVRRCDWDSVVDVSWQPVLVGSAVEALADRTRHWTYVSSCSVYRDWSTTLQDDTAPLVSPWTGSGAVGVEDYPGAKVACEQLVAAGVPADRLLVARAGLIAGFGDLSDRLGYWPARYARSTGDDAVLSPAGGTDVQVVDVEDLAAWIVRAGVSGTAAVCDAVGEPLTFSDLHEACATATGRRPRTAEADDAWLLDHDVRPWMGPESLPVWLPDSPDGGRVNRRNHRARALGLVPRPLSETVASALAWEERLGPARWPRRAGLSPARERELLAELEAAGAG